MLRKNLKEDGKIFSVYTNEENTSVFGVGYSIATTENELLLHCISENGYDDGLSCIYLNDIYRLSCDGKYEKKIKKIEKELNQYNINLIENNIMKSLIIYAIENNYMVGIDLYDSEETDIIGYVDSFNDEWIAINEYDDYGEKDGKTFVKLDSISVLSCNSQTIRKIQFLSSLMK